MLRALGDESRVIAGIDTSVVVGRAYLAKNKTEDHNVPSI